MGRHDIVIRLEL